ncbi:MAG: Ig-like domain-containing protein, partial [Limisphaerales bacterium]
GSVNINQGDEVDVFNLDTSETLNLTWTDPASWSDNVPPYDGQYYYYAPVVFNNPGTYYMYDQYVDDVVVTVNSTAPPPPLSVLITTPTNNAVFTAPGTFTITAVPSGGPASYGEVDFYVGTNYSGVAYESPYTNSIVNLPAGSYNISAIVTDDDLNTATNSIQVTVQPLLVTNYIVPVVCEDIASDGIVADGYLDADASGGDQGTMEFAEFNTSQCIAIQLEVNAYAEPCYSPQVNVYGFDGGNGALSISNYNSGTLAGTFSVPEYPGYGVPLTVDVTSFVKSTKGPYFGLYLQATNGGGDQFSSLGENYGLPPELYVISLAPPPPPAIAMAANKLVVSWSTNNAFGATLQTSPTIGPGAQWVPVNLTPALVNGQWTVTNIVSGISQFFRLSTTN